MTEDTLEKKLRIITNRLFKISLGCTLDEFSIEENKLREENYSIFQDKMDSFNRRILDVKRIMFIDSMDCEAVKNIYIEYEKIGYENISHEISSLISIYIHICDIRKKNVIEKRIIEIIRNNSDDKDIEMDLELIPNLVKKALGSSEER